MTGEVWDGLRWGLVGIGGKSGDGGLRGGGRGSGDLGILGFGWRCSLFLGLVNATSYRASPCKKFRERRCKNDVRSGSGRRYKAK